MSRVRHFIDGFSLGLIGIFAFILTIRVIAFIDPDFKLFLINFISAW